MRKIQHVFLEGRHLGQPVHPTGGDIDMAGRTGAGTAAFGLDPTHPFIPGGFHQRQAGNGIHDALAAIGFDKGDLDHVAAP